MKVKSCFLVCKLWQVGMRSSGQQAAARSALSLRMATAGGWPGQLTAQRRCLPVRRSPTAS